MPLENASYIHQLEPSNPAGTDQLTQGDDHLRMIKAAIKATFPKLTGPVTKTQDELNATGFSMPIGIISLWFGTAATVPAGWAICNGQTLPRSDGNGSITTPDLRDRVAVGAGTLIAQGATAGAATATGTTGSAGAHVHTISGGAHTHNVNVSQASVGGSVTTKDREVDGSGSGASRALTTATFTPGPAHTHDATAESNTHSHTVSSEGAHAHSLSVSTVQPSLGLHYIIKV